MPSLGAEAPSAAVDLQLATEVASCYADPLRFVQLMYPWGQPGLLQQHSGPDVWQTTFLTQLGQQVARRGFDGLHSVMPIRMGVSSGHGIGKSVLVSWLVGWIMATRPNAQGVITANTSTQLETKTWAAIRRWTKLCLVSHWFEINSARMYRKGYPESWFCTPQTCREENSEAFAGQHAADATSFYIFDEASAIPGPIYEVAEGGLTDGEPMQFLFGNPTRSHGDFHKAVFGTGRDKWITQVVDARECKFTNKELHEEWLKEHGEDSDFFRVRVRGLPPRASDLQYIDAERVYQAQRRDLEAFADDPLLCGLDVARGGSDNCVFWFRKGLDGFSVPPVRIPGEQARDSMRLVSVAAEILNKHPIVKLFVDGTGIGGPIADRLMQLGYRDRVVEVQFGSESPDVKYANMRAYMWGKMRDWLERGRIPKDARLEQDLTAPGYSHDKRDRLLLESKEHMKDRGIDSPDDGDALALTFAMPVALTGRKTGSAYRPITGQHGWMS